MKELVFQNCLGAIHEKLTSLKKPNSKGALYCNYKQYCSIVVMAIVNSDYCFSMVDIGACGSCSIPKYLRIQIFGSN